ncbi:MAG: hypothetical protein AABY32_02215 [Nanoarchaeota archaeon]
MNKISQWARINLEKLSQITDDNVENQQNVRMQQLLNDFLKNKKFSIYDINLIKSLANEFIKLIKLNVNDNYLFFKIPNHSYSYEDMEDAIISKMKEIVNPI